MRQTIAFLDRAQRWILQPLLVILIVAGGFLGARKLSERREAPRSAIAAIYAPLVRSTVVTVGSHRVNVRGNGVLAARSRIGLVPQVGGEVISIHSELRAGGQFRAGEELLEIEPRDYELAAASAAADVAAATTVVQEIEARAETARVEWRALHGDRPATPLVVLEPQVAEAKARLAAANAALDKAKLDLERTRIVARFDGRVVSASVDVGQVVAPNQRIGEVYAVDVLELTVPLAQDELRWIVLPGERADVAPTSVELRARVDGRDVTLEGCVARLEAELAAGTRLARVVVELQSSAIPAELRLRLIPGTFVETSFAGEVLTDVTQIPRAALREDGIVWVIVEGRVRFARPEVLHNEGERLIVRGLVDGARIVTSDLEVVTDGMDVRLADEGELR
jgi:multidrug efflux system membrane fusion protein